MKKKLVYHHIAFPQDVDDKLGRLAMQASMSRSKLIRNICKQTVDLKPGLFFKEPEEYKKVR